MDTFNNYIHLSRHARYDYNKKRRELFNESVDRYGDFIKTHINNIINLDGAIQAIKDHKVMPSMRMLKTAGPALKRDNAAGYNCSALAIDNEDSFSEAMYLLLCGVGVGCSVESKFITKLATVPHDLKKLKVTYVIEDSRNGWVEAFRSLIRTLYQGFYFDYNYSQIRPAGSILLTFGGRAAGPDALKDIMDFTINTFTKSRGRKLKSIECFDLMCKIGSVVAKGGVRRAAIIALTDLDDLDMAHAKTGEWWKDHDYRRFSNISAVYDNAVTPYDTFSTEWQNLIDSRSGERGIFNRYAVKSKIKALGQRDPNHEYLVNPCGEIFLKNRQFCNLSEVIARPDDDLRSLMEKIKYATLLGTIQATFTEFASPLSPVWKSNGDTERLLGVSITGVLDCPFLLTCSTQDLQFIKKYAQNINKDYAKILGINPALAVTTIKPSGTVSLVVNSSPGLNPSYSNYYIRGVRESIDDPISKFMINAGVPYEPEIGQSEGVVFYFPRKTNSVIRRKELSAIHHINLYHKFNTHWSDHNISLTVYVKENEWDTVKEHVYANLNRFNGITFMPFNGDDSCYVQAPFRECSQEEYENALCKMPDLDWSKLSEQSDTTKASQEFSCVGGSCSI